MKHLLNNEIKEFVGKYQKEPGISTQWGVPLVGMASAEDPLFAQLSSVASPTHALPGDFLSSAGTVIAYFLPFEKTVTRTNIKGRHSSREWGRAYVETNELIRQLSLHLQELMTRHGQDSVVIPATHNWDEEKLISDWSHRHVAYIAGLGKFGLNNMLITRKGCCGRVGSFITSARLPADQRPAHEACLYKADGTCKKCTQRCVNGALGPASFDRFKCYEMLLENVEELRSVGYADVCGKCLVALPCSHMNPVQRKFKHDIQAG